MTDTSAPPITQEISASGDGTDITQAYYGPMAPVRDSVLNGLGQRWEAYREIRRDPQVHATFQQRRLAVVSRPLIVTPGADDAASIAAAEQLEANLKAIAFDRATKSMSWGLFYGFAVGECLWEIKDGKVWLGQIKGRTPWRFRYSKTGELRLLTMKALIEGEVMPERKFWTLSTGADNDDDPYGLGLAHQLYWPVYFKKMGLSFWLRALEKFGAPTAVGTYPAGASAEDQKKLLAAAMAIRIDGAVIKPEGTVLELLEATRGTVDQATFYKFCNSDISKVVLGQTMTTDDGSSLAQGKVHFDVRDELTDADVEELCESFCQGPAKWLTEWNFPGAAVPILSRPSPDDEERVSKLTKERSETMKTMGEAGFEPEDDTLANLFPGWRRRAPGAPAPAPGLPSPAFAEGSQDMVDAYLDELDWEPLVSPIIKAAKDLIDAAPDLATAAERLAGLFTSEPLPAAFADQLGEVLFQARAAGRHGLGLDDGQSAEGV